MSFTLLGILQSQAAGGGVYQGPAYDFLTSVSDTASTITVNNLSTDYDDFIIEFHIQVNSASQHVGPTTMVMNGSSAGNNRFYVNNDGGGASNSAQINQSTNYLTQNTNGDQNGWWATSARLFLTDVHSTTRPKSYYSQWWAYGNRGGMIAGAFDNTAAITSLTFTTPATNNWFDIAIYGLRTR